MKSQEQTPKLRLQRKTITKLSNLQLRSIVGASDVDMCHHTDPTKTNP
jgi:hypothetical protein